MKKFLMALAVLAIASSPALAGPNENGVVMVHNTGITFTNELALPPVSPVPACVDIVDEVPMGSNPGDPSETLVWKVYAVFPPQNSPRLKTVAWGIQYIPVNAGAITIAGNDAPSPAVFFQTSTGWPGSGTTVGESFTDSVRVDTVNELWWFGGYAYAGLGGEPQTFCIIPKIGDANFGDDQIPANIDPITGYGCLGFGHPGSTICPTGVIVGACCFTDGSCLPLTAVDCQTAGGSFVGGACTPGLCPIIVYGACCVNGACNVVTPAVCAGAGGTYYGDGSVCTPDLCPPIPTENTSWGQIKNSYR